MIALLIFFLKLNKKSIVNENIDKPVRQKKHELDNIQIKHFKWVKRKTK